MKKLVFSAVALVTFSFAGMANNEVKEVEKKEEKVALRNNCDAVADKAYESAQNSGQSQNEAYETSLNAYNDCLDLHNKYDISLESVD